MALPSSYSSLPFQQIKISHVPATSEAVTPVVLLSLHRPTKNNAFTESMMEELLEAYRLFDLDDRIRAIVFTGTGKMFCAGFDLEIGFPGSSATKDGVQNAESKGRDNDHRDTGGRVVLAIHHCRKPTIMAVNGHAVGVGATLQLPAAIRVACATAKIGFVFARRGLVMEACSSFYLPRLIGFSRAMHLVYTGAIYMANDPLLRGLYSEVLPTPEKTLERALAIADDVAKNTSLVSTHLMKEMMYRGTGSPEAQHLLDSRIIHGLQDNPDNLEGVQSFFEKRTPNFTDTVDRHAPASYPWWNKVDTGSTEQGTKTSKL